MCMVLLLLSLTGQQGGLVLMADTDLSKAKCANSFWGK